MTVADRVRRFVIDNFYVQNPVELGDHTPLVGSGTVDSTGMLEIIAFLETEFGISITDFETTPDNLGSIAGISAFVARKRSAQTA